MDGQYTKSKQRQDKEDRTSDYRQWRFGFGNHKFVSDIDQVEYRIVDGRIIPVALLELTRIDGDVPIRHGYLSSILQRFAKRDAQKKFIIEMAKKLDVNVYIVAFRYTLEEFWLYNLSKSKGWACLNKKRYSQWIKDLPNAKIKPIDWIVT
jgi:hypothetical protein